MNPLEEALAKHYAKRGDGDENASPVASWGAFVSDPQMEAELARRERDPDAFGPLDMATAIYAEHQKRAAAAEETKS